MRLPFTPNHVRLIQACYPPSSGLLNAGPEYRPNSQEISRLTYYASNRPGKLAKLGNELEKRAKLEAQRARSGNARARASLLITLAIFKALVTECRRDVSLLTPALISSVVAALSAFPRDLEVVARSASAFTAWTTYTDGQLIGVDSTLTFGYKTALQCFAELSRVPADKGDGEVRNRRRLVGIAALTGVVTSDALYHPTSEFQNQMSIIIPGLLRSLQEAELDIVKDEAAAVKEQPSASSAYLSEFRPRPLAERRAASIHVHIDGDRGPEFSDVVNASLRAFQSLLERSNAYQVSAVLEAAFEDAEKQHWWDYKELCRWLAQTTADWIQYQYRYAVPKKLVDKLVLVQDAPVPTPMHFSLASMIDTVFTSPTPLVNLSTSDIISYLLILLIRRTSINPEDGLLPALVDCTAALGTHVYYQDQIHDLAEELASRLVSVQVNGLLGRGRSGSEPGREQGMRVLLAALRGLLRPANKHETSKFVTANGIPENSPTSPVKDGPSAPDIGGSQASAASTKQSQRTRVSPEIWQDTLALLCEADYGVRADYARALVQFIRTEVHKEPFALHVGLDEAGSGDTPVNRAPTILSTRRATPGVVTADPTSRFLNALHASVFTLATSSALGLSSSPTGSTHSSSQQLTVSHAFNPPALNVITATPLGTPGTNERGELPLTEESQPDSPTQIERPPSLPPQQPSKTRHSISLNGPRSRRLSVPLSLLDLGPGSGCAPAATPSDYSHLLNILTAVHERLPGRALFTGVPMLLALDTNTMQQIEGHDLHATEKRRAVRELIARVWKAIGKVWECEEVTAVAQKALASLGGPILPLLPPTPEELVHTPEEPIDWSAVPRAEGNEASPLSRPFIDPDLVVQALAANHNVQAVTSLDRGTLLRRLALEWTLESALKDSVERQSSHDILRGEGVSPFLKISPALMHIENLSLQSLARTQHGVGVHDLREALEGRGSTPNLGLNSTRPSSVKTLDQSSVHGGERPGLARSLTQARTTQGAPSDVRDMLNKLGVGKQNGSNLLKASFPALQKPDPNKSRSSVFIPPYRT